MYASMSRWVLSNSVTMLGVSRKTGVVGDERDVQPSSGGGDPSVRLVVLLTERVSVDRAIATKCHIGVDEPFASPHHFGNRDTGVESPETLVAPVGEEAPKRTSATVTNEMKSRAPSTCWR